MPRVAVLTTSYPAYPGDPSGHFVETEARLLARDTEVVVITAGVGSRGVPAPRLERGGVAVWRVNGGDAFGWPGVTARVRDRPSRLMSVFAWTSRACALLGALPPFDRVIAHWAIPCGFPVALSAGRGREPAMIELVSHGADVRALVRLPSFARHALVDRLLDQVTRWRFVSERLRDELASTLRPRSVARLTELAFVAPPAIDIPDVAARAAALRRLGGDDALVVLVGRLVASKRFDRALDHVADDVTRAKRRHVVVVGDGPERGRLEAHARARGIHARFVGRTSREDAVAWIGAADALIHASRAEGLSTVVREAEALGVPVERVP